MRIAQTQTEDEASVTLMPLIDMVFLLLIFFLVATTFAEIEVDRSLELPGSDAPKPLSDPPKDVIINITPDGKAMISGIHYEGDELLELLDDVAVNQTDREILIRADERGVVKHLADVLEIVHKAGIDKTKIGYLLRSETSGRKE